MLPIAYPTLDLPGARRYLERIQPDAATLATAFEGPTPPIVEISNFFRDATVMLFPTWLPEADGIGHAGGSGRSALRYVAMKASRSTIGVNPVLEPLAIEALTGQHAPLTDLADETIVRACASLIERSYGGAGLLLLLAVPDEHDKNAISHAVSWLAGLSVGQVFICGPGALGCSSSWRFRTSTIRMRSVTRCRGWRAYRSVRSSFADRVRAA
ncbi:MAG: hypothetical protein ROR55_10970 [Devosia sp.]